MKHMFQGLIDETMEKGIEKGVNKGIKEEKYRIIHTMKQKHYTFEQVKDFYDTLTEKEWDAISVCSREPEYKA